MITHAFTKENFDYYPDLNIITIILVQVTETFGNVHYYRIYVAILKVKLCLSKNIYGDNPDLYSIPRNLYDLFANIIGLP